MHVADLPRVLQADPPPPSGKLSPQLRTLSCSLGTLHLCPVLAVPGAALLECDSHWLALPESQGQPEWLGCADQVLQVGTEAETPLCIMKSIKKGT